MKSIKRNLNWAAKILSLLILLQSCSAYHNYTSSIDEAIATNNKIKTDLSNEDSYKFIKLVRLENEIYGVAKKKSPVSKKLNTQVVDSQYEGKYNLIKLNEADLQNIHLKNKGASTALTIAIPVVIVGVIAIIGGEAWDNALD